MGGRSLTPTRLALAVATKASSTLRLLHYAGLQGER